MRGASRTGGEIIEVQGGHIVRSTGRKDRHSKVCTAKGPRDRRVRLSAHTAIQFYDVQDRLGYDRPSKAVDWLITKAKSAIDELAELPAWNPTVTTAATTLNTHQRHHHETDNPIGVRSHVTAATYAGVGTPSSRATNSLVGLHHQQQQLPPPSFDTDMVSFFPTSVTAEETTSSSTMIQFQRYPPDLLSRTSSSTHNNNNNNNNNNQDLRLSLQSIQDPVLLHQHQAQTQTHHHHHHQNEHQHVLFSGTTPLGGFDGMVAWNASADTGNNGHGGAGGGGFIFNTPSPSPAPAPSPAVFLGQSQYLSQRGPLQSSNTPSVRAWIEPSGTFADHHYLSPATMNPSSSVSGIGFASSGGGFSGFRIPARIQGEEEHGGVSDKPSSVSSDSRH